MPTYEIKAPDGNSYRIDGPAGASDDQVREQVLKQHPKAEEGAGKLERLGQGFMDPIYGAAQIGSRMTEEGFSSDPEAAEKTRQERIQTVDTAVKEREKGIQAKRPQAERNTTDWLRVGGSIPSTIALTSPTLAFGGIPGAVLGGAAGAAIQPTTDTENFGSEKAKSAAEGGVAGGVLGAGFKGVGAGVRALGSYLAREYPENVMTQAVQKILKRMGQDEKAGGPTAQQAIDLINEAQGVGRATLQRVQVAPIPGYSQVEAFDIMSSGQPSGRVLVDVSDRTKPLIMDISSPGGPGSLKSTAMRDVMSQLSHAYPEATSFSGYRTSGARLQAGATGTASVVPQAGRAPPNPKPLTLADVGGENTRALAGNVARQPGESRNVATQFLNERDAGAGQRLNADIARYVHGGESMHRATQAMVEARSEAGRPAWEAVRRMEGVYSPRLQQFIDDPSLRAGMARGYEIERLESLAENRPFNPTQMGIELDNEGNVRVVRSPNMRVLHMGKMGLDAMIADERNEITGRLSQRGVALDRVRRAYLQEIDSLDHTGTYRNARALWEGPSSSMDAIRAGRGIFTSAPDEIAHELAAMSPANQEFYRLGVADMVREKLMKTGFSGNDANAIIKNPWMRQQLQPIFRSEADFNAFVQGVTHESQMFGTKAETLGGPQTAKRLAEDTSTENTMAAHGMHMGEQVATGKWVSAVKTAVRMWRDRQDRAGNPRLNEQIARILFQTPIDPGGEVGQRLTGQFKGPQGVNPLAPYAAGVEETAKVLAPGAGSALSQPTQ